MRIRYRTWSMAAILLLGTAALGNAALPNGAAGDTGSSVSKASTPAKNPPTSTHTSKTSARRRPTHSAHRVVAHAQLAPEPSRISEIQAALAREGAYQGDPNGHWDATTVDAMKQFQSDHDLNPTGKIDALTLQKLGLGSQVAGMGAPLPTAVPQASNQESIDQTQHP